MGDVHLDVGWMTLKVVQRTSLATRKNVYVLIVFVMTMLPARPGSIVTMWDAVGMDVERMDVRRGYVVIDIMSVAFIV